MRTLAQKPKTIQQPASPKLKTPSRSFSGHSPEVRSVLHLQHMIGNQAVSQLPRPSVEEHEEGLSIRTAPHGFAHDFSSVPIYAKASESVHPKLRVGSQGDQYEQEADRVADQVMGMPEPRIQRACTCGGGCSTCRKEELPKAAQDPTIPLLHPATLTGPHIQRQPDGDDGAHTLTDGGADYRVLGKIIRHQAKGCLPGVHVAVIGKRGSECDAQAQIAEKAWQCIADESECSEKTLRVMIGLFGPLLCNEFCKEQGCSLGGTFLPPGSCDHFSCNAFPEYCPKGCPIAHDCTSNWEPSKARWNCECGEFRNV